MLAEVLYFISIALLGFVVLGAVSIGSLAAPIAAALALRRLLSTRDLFFAICGAAVLGLIGARFAFGRGCRLIA